MGSRQNQCSSMEDIIADTFKITFVICVPSQENHGFVAVHYILRSLNRQQVHRTVRRRGKPSFGTASVNNVVGIKHFQQVKTFASLVEFPFLAFLWPQTATPKRFPCIIPSLNHSNIAMKLSTTAMCFNKIKDTMLCCQMFLARRRITVVHKFICPQSFFRIYMWRTVHISHSQWKIETQRMFRVGERTASPLHGMQRAVCRTTVCQRRTTQSRKYRLFRSIHLFGSHPFITCLIKITK